ncbi:hypothetical protein, partial [Clostridioides difficile]|uniref:hypothetical protein n=1 Tax=Clostridioides difficile TaxID=1496 RepID=UPI001A9A3AA9
MEIVKGVSHTNHSIESDKKGALTQITRAQRKRVGHAETGVNDVICATGVGEWGLRGTWGSR